LGVNVRYSVHEQAASLAFSGTGGYNA